jgi:hypothetical protein
MNSRRCELRKGDFGYEDLTVGSFGPRFRSSEVRDCELQKGDFGNLQSRTRAQKTYLNRNVFCSCSYWLINVVDCS